MKAKLLKTKWFIPTKNALIILLASLLFAVGMEMFLVPNNLNIGGFIGIAQIISLLNIKFLSNGFLYIILNIPVLIAAGFFFSKKFVLYTSSEVILSGVFMDLFYRLKLADFIGLADKTNLTLIALSGGIIVGASIAATFTIGSSSGGTDIISLLVQKKFKLNSAFRIFLIFDALVILIYSILLKDTNILFYSITSLITYQVGMEMILNGISNAVLFEIITDNSEALVKAISEKLARGSTMFKAVGTYTKKEKEVVVCVVRKRQATQAASIIKELAPDSFFYSIPIKEVIGEGFKNLNF